MKDKIKTPFTFARRSRESERTEEKRVRSGSLAGLLFIYIILLAFHLETSVYGWAVLSVITILSFVMVIIWLIELKDGKI